MRDSKLKRELIRILDAGYEIYRILELRTCYRMKIMSWKKTIRYIKNKHCSIARFGDGEFNFIQNTRDEGYQKNSPALAKGLAEVFQNRNPNLLICIPGCMNTFYNLSPKSKVFWRDWGKNNHHKDIVRMIWEYTGRDYVFGDSQISRPYIDWKSDKRAKKTFPMLQELWNERDVLIVEGRYTCLGVGNDLFSNANSIRRIIGPAVGAFEKYDEIFRKILEYAQNRLIIMALGPTATILASDLANLGIQALDIGHIDIEYEWFRMGTRQKVAIPGKYTNEAKETVEHTVCTDPTYLGEIVACVE